MNPVVSAAVLGIEELYAHRDLLELLFNVVASGASKDAVMAALKGAMVAAEDVRVDIELGLADVK